MSGSVLHKNHNPSLLNFRVIALEIWSTVSCKSPYCGNPAKMNGSYLIVVTKPIKHTCN